MIRRNANVCGISGMDAERESAALKRLCWCFVPAMAHYWASLRASVPASQDKWWAAGEVPDTGKNVPQRRN